MTGQRVDEPVGAPEPGECFHAPAHRLDLRRPVEAEQSSGVDRVDARQPLGAGLADQGGEHHRHHQRAQPVEGGPSRGVDGRRGVEQARARRAPAG